jgi:hypothetical protein
MVRSKMAELSIQSILLAEKFGIRDLLIVMLGCYKPPELFLIALERCSSWASDTRSHGGGGNGTEIGLRNDWSKTEASRIAC